MSFKKTLLSMCILAAFLSVHVSAVEIFIYRPQSGNDSVSAAGKITLHGEYFGYLQMPSNFPSYNNLSGPTDRWSFGFQNTIHLTSSTVFLAQLVTHDDGQKRTKFDWHFSLRQKIFDNLVFILGHDSNHDSDFQSYLGGKPFYLNRNYIGLGLPFLIGDVYFEPFTWFFHNSNHPGHLDLSGDVLAQEYGLRIGTWIKNVLGIHFQAFAQTETIFSLGEAFMADLIVRYRILNFLELSAGARIWADIGPSRLENRKSFFKMMWGIAIPF